MMLAAGGRLGAYELLSQVGVGRMGEDYTAPAIGGSGSSPDMSGL